MRIAVQKKEDLPLIVVVVVVVVVACAVVIAGQAEGIQVVADVRRWTTRCIICSSSRS